MKKLDRAVRNLLAEIQEKHVAVKREHPLVTLVLGSDCATLLSQEDDLNLVQWLRVLESILAHETGLQSRSQTWSQF